MKKFVLLFGILFTSNFSWAQINDPTDVAKGKATQKVNQKTDEAIDAGIDAIEDGINSVFKKKEKKKDERKKKNSKSKPSHTNSSNSNTNTNEDETDFSEYEGSTFVSGKEVLFFEDFSTAQISSGSGNWFVNNWDQENPAQITSLNGKDGNWLKIPRYGHFFPNGFKNLPDNCTIEWDMYIDAETVSEMQSGLRFSFVARDDRENFDLHFNEKPEVTLDVHPYGSEGFLNISATREYGLDPEIQNFYTKTYKNTWKSNEINRMAISRNGNSIKIFHNGKELVNLQNAFLKKGNYMFTMSSNQWGNGMYITNVRVGGKVPNATQEIKSDGKFVTNAIYFDVNSSRIKPESWATLDQVAEAIRTTSGTIQITGHTDGDGADEANLTLSKNRAESVKNTLVNEFGIDASRLQTDGKGESQPIDSNQTTSGKAQNRRVEFIKI